MNKYIKSIICLSLTVVGILSANANVSFTITADDATHIKVFTQEWNSEIQDLVPNYIEPEGNVFSIDVPEYEGIKVKGINPWCISAIKYDNGDEVQDIYQTGNTWTITAYSSMNNKNLNVDTFNADLDRTCSFTFNVDDASAVNVYLQPNEYQPDINNGENILKFNPETEYNIFLIPTDYSMTFYSVTLDDTSIYPDMYGMYSFDLTDGCTVNVITKAPEGDATITFNYSDGGEGCIEKVLVDGEEIELSKEITVADGSFIELFKSENYDIQSWRIGTGENQAWSGVSQTFSVAGDTELYFDAAARKFLSYTVIVNNADEVLLFKQNENYESQRVELISGENHLRIPESNTYIYWYTNPGYIIESVYVTTQGGDPELYTGGSAINVEEGMVINISDRELSRNQTTVIWCDGIENHGGRILTRSYEEICELHDGYNVFNYDAAENPLTVDTDFGSTSPKFNFFYLNGELLTPMYPPYPSYSAIFTDLSVGKFFLNSRPIECQVSFEIGENVDIDVTRDVIVPVTDFSIPVDCFEGTQFKIDSKDGIVVYIDDMEIDPEEDGSYLIEADGNVTIKVEDKEKVGVYEVVESINSREVYNISGVSLGKIEDINTLPAGIYIVGGKKIVVR